MQLSEIIIRKIQKEGLISFRDFMEMSLYYPGLAHALLLDMGMKFKYPPSRKGLKNISFQD